MRQGFAVLATAVAMLAAPSAASALQLVSTTGTDSADCSVTPCLHIQQAVNNAIVGETVAISPGVYDTEPNNQVVVNKGINISGAGPNQVFLDGNSAQGLPTPGTLSIQTSTTDTVSVNGLTVREPGSTSAAHAGDAHYGIYFKSTASPAPAYTLTTVNVVGNGAGGRDYNVYSVGDTSSLTISGGQFTNADFNPILLERHQGTSNISGNTITKPAGTANSSAYFDMNYAPALPGTINGSALSHKFNNNTVNAGGFSGATFNARPTFVGGTIGGYDDIEVSGNTFTNIGATGVGVSIANDTTDPDGSDAEIKSATVNGNSITGPGATGLRFRGLVNDIDVNQNQIVGGFVRSIHFADSASGSYPPGPSEVHRNRLVGATGQGILQDGANLVVVDAENNWYGCNEGPNADPGCTSVLATAGAVDFDPWLVLRVSAAPTSIPTGGSNSTITANLNFNSAGANVGTAHRDGFPVAWTTNLGTIAPPSSPLAAGVATSTLTSGAVAGTADPAATVDNETTSTPVQFVDDDFPDTVITSGPTNGVTLAQTSASFAFNSPNDPAATFQCRIDSASDADWVACTSPKAYANLTQGPHVFEVRAVDINNNPDPTPARGVFNVDTTPGGGVAGDASPPGAGACNNRIPGDAKPNDLKGTNKGDRILGFSADDSLSGNGGYDCLKGGKADDALDGGLAGDILQGGPGDDAIDSLDGKRDKLNCGSGQDAALVDQRDVVKNCEAIRVRLRT